MLARLVPVVEARLVGEVADVVLAPTLCLGEWIRDWTDLDLLGADGADRGVGAFLTGVVGAFSKPRPGGLAGDREFVFELESGARCLGLTEEVGDLARGGIA
jgi:hypothetical protein